MQEYYERFCQHCQHEDNCWYRWKDKIDFNSLQRIEECDCNGEFEKDDEE